MAENFFGTTNTGRMRSNNEDTFLAEALPNGWIVACVIDGVGGYEGGEVAAEIARETLRGRLLQPYTDPVEVLKESVLAANQNIYQEKHRSNGNSQMACVLTATLVDLDSNQFYYAHVGDTRLYLLRDQSLVKVTKDHSFVGFLEDSGRLTEDEAMQHPKRNEINKALGFDPQIDLRSDYIETGTSPFLPGDLLLLCSDGLTDLVNRKEMTGILLSDASLQEKGQDLVDAANTAGGKDNITVVIVTNNKKPLRIKATKPIAPKKKENKRPVKKVAETEVVQQPVRATTVEKKKSFPWLPVLIGVLLVGALAVYFWWRKPEVQQAPPPVAHVSNAGEQKLSDTLHQLTGDTLSLLPSAFASSITLGQTMEVSKDTLYLLGNNTVLVADSLFNGPAINVAYTNKILSLENLVFRDFETAIVLQGKGLRLKNVRFVNCKVPVQHNLMLHSDSILNGFVRDTFIVSRTSLPK